MIIVNTTFHVPVRMKRHMVQWLNSTYSSSASEAGLTAPETTRVLGGDDEEGVSLAFRVQATSLSQAHKWNEGEADILRRKLLAEYGSNLAYFTTYLATEE